ncbi:hypothetical protein [Psychrobacter sp. JCM 18901]|uniref:hypothetical protein n=1 Tax=Psychrobacter sp. JCM 18901 TaxID=1298609 RepID=UPI0004B08716|nr:hypothetical protein [Psychrobacter sp. JCM 18901]
MSDIAATDLEAAYDKRKMWNQMRMMPTDFTDLSGEKTFTYLMNGKTTAANWTKLVKAGQPVKLRFINASAQTIFDVRIPGLKMTVVATDGIDVAPVAIDDFRIGVAETYDVIVTLLKMHIPYLPKISIVQAMSRPRLRPRKALVLQYLLWIRSNG